LPVEDRHYDKLLNDTHTSNIFEAEIKGRPNRTIYTEKAPLSSDKSSSTKFYSGRIYDPAYDGNVIQFQLRSMSDSSGSYDNKEYVSNASNIGPAGFSVTYQAMNLPGFISREGNVSLSAWEILDRANSASRKSPIYQAFVTQIFKQMTSVRPYAWGLHLCPSAKAQFEALDKAVSGETIVSGAWMLPNWKERLSANLSPLFAKPTSFRKEAVYIQSLAQACASGGLQYAGFVGSDGVPVLAGSITLPDSLWGMAGEPDDYKPTRVFALQKKGDSTEYAAVAKAIPFSPLFKFSGDRKAVWKRAWDASGLASTPEAKVTTPPLFADFIPGN